MASDLLHTVKFTVHDLLMSELYVCMYLLVCRYRWAFIPEVDVDHYDGPGNTLLEGEQECKPHVVRVLDGINRRYGVRSPCTETHAWMYLWKSTSVPVNVVLFQKLTQFSVCKYLEYVFRSWMEQLESQAQIEWSFLYSHGVPSTLSWISCRSSAPCAALLMAPPCTPRIMPLTTHRPAVIRSWNA